VIFISSYLCTNNEKCEGAILEQVELSRTAATVNPVAQGHGLEDVLDEEAYPFRAARVSEATAARTGIGLQALMGWPLRRHAWASRRSLDAFRLAVYLRVLYK
jgi:uncharacterized caspase-like protein